MTYTLRISRPVILLVILTLVVLFSIRHRPYLPSNAIDASVSLQAVLDVTAASIHTSASTFDLEWARRELGVEIGSLDPDEYESELRSLHDEFFAHSSYTSLLPRILSYLSLVPVITEPLPQIIYTTDLRTPNELPDQFRAWAGMNPNWTTRFVSDEDMDGWLEENFDVGEFVVEEMKALKRSRGIIRSDLFRYFVLFLHGGIYTDTDTACVRPIAEWTARVHTPSTFPLLSALPDLLRLARSAPIEKNDDGPSLLVSIEFDGSDQDWRGMGHARGLQIVQWTLLAKKGHPVMLDVIGKALSQARKVREAEVDGTNMIKTDVDVLDWTGPGAFSDAVLRYLLIRYGVHPSELLGLDRAVRYGDVVILPEHSFHADASEGWQPEGKMVWHGFFGRWRAQT